MVNCFLSFQFHKFSLPIHFHLSLRPSAHRLNWEAKIKNSQLPTSLLRQRAFGLSFYFSNSQSMEVKLTPNFPWLCGMWKDPSIILEETNYAMYAQALVMSRRGRTKSLKLPLGPWAFPRIFFPGKGGDVGKQDLTLFFKTSIYIYSNKSMIGLAFEYCVVSNITYQCYHQFYQVPKWS